MINTQRTRELWHNTTSLHVLTHKCLWIKTIQPATITTTKITIQWQWSLFHELQLKLFTSKTINFILRYRWPWYYSTSNSRENLSCLRTITVDKIFQQIQRYWRVVHIEIHKYCLKNPFCYFSLHVENKASGGLLFFLSN